MFQANIIMVILYGEIRRVSIKSPERKLCPDIPWGISNDPLYKPILIAIFNTINKVFIIIANSSHWFPLYYLLKAMNRFIFFINAVKHLLSWKLNKHWKSVNFPFAMIFMIFWTLKYTTNLQTTQVRTPLPTYLT